MKCPRCGTNSMHSVYFFKNTKDVRKWIKVGYYCLNCRTFMTPEEYARERLMFDLNDDVVERAKSILNKEGGEQE